ncbi:MAG: hypothetical protein ABSG01_07060 [Anaerolineales bacterium]|jgi:hypothetical protein
MKDDQIEPFEQMLDPQDARISTMLQKVAAQTNVNLQFQNELEMRLKNAYKPKRISFITSLKKVAPTVAWVLAVIAMVFLLDWAIRSLAPQPKPAAGNTVIPTASSPEATPTPPETQNKASATPNDSGYSWNGTTLYLQGPLPDSPSEANIYLLQPDQHATLDEAVALAGRFGIQGEVYKSAGELSGTTDYVITDGKQRMTIRSDHYFSYYADYPNSQALPGDKISTSEAAANIDAFLKSRGFNFEYKIDSTDMWGTYYVTPLSPDGFAVHQEDLRPSGLLFTLDASGQVASVQANLVDYQTVGTYAIRTAQEAWKTLLDSGIQSGKLEWTSSPSGPSREWLRTYPLNQTETIYSYVSSIPSAETGKSPLTLVGMYSATGNVAGLDQIPSNTLVEATGQFVTEGGITKFNLDSWKATSLIEDGIQGTLEIVGGQVTLSAQEGNFQLVDVPTDVPLPFENAFVVGVRLGNTYDWTSIDNRGGPGGSGGGGSGGGQGFYKINFSGTPVPLPTAVPTPLPPEQQPTGQTIEGQRGLLGVTIYKQSDGSQRVEYALVTWNGTDSYTYYMILEGNLQGLQSYNNRPVDIWGTVDHINQDGTPVIKVDRYEVPFPDAQFQLLRGTQKIIQLEGQPATLFTTDTGDTYVQQMPNGVIDHTEVGHEGDPALIEALVIPGESLAGYPAVVVFGAQMANNPKAGQPIELTITADQLDQPYVTYKSQAPDDSVTNPPTATVEKVELVYFVSDPRYATGSNSGYPYLQPAWRFYGHYSNGDEFEVLIQALQDEYLLPELAPHIPPG